MMETLTVKMSLGQLKNQTWQFGRSFDYSDSLLYENTINQSLGLVNVSYLNFYI